MITFKETHPKLTLIRKLPEEYDILFFNYKGVRFWPYTDYETLYGQTFGKVYPPYNVGWEYHILKYKTFLRNTVEVDHFNACLVNPLDFAEAMNGQFWHGFIGKRSYNSKTVFDYIHNEILTKKGKINERLLGL